MFVLFKLLTDYSKYYSVGKWQYIFTLTSQIKMKNKNQVPPKTYPLKTSFILKTPLLKALWFIISYTQIIRQILFISIFIVLFNSIPCHNNNLYCGILYYIWKGGCAYLPGMEICSRQCQSKTVSEIFKHNFKSWKRQKQLLHMIYMTMQWLLVSLYSLQFQRIHLNILSWNLHVCVFCSGSHLRFLIDT